MPWIGEHQLVHIRMHHPIIPPEEIADRIRYLRQALILVERTIRQGDHVRG